MHLGIDAHALGTRAGGNESYMRSLLAALAAHPAPGVRVTAFTHPDRDPAAVAPFAAAPLPVRSSYLRVPAALPWAAHRAALDLLHVQYTAPPVCPCPYVVSMHDVVVRRFPESMPPLDRWRLQLLTPATLRRAARIFTLTTAIRNEIHALHGIPLERFDVVSPAPDPIFRTAQDPDAVTAALRRYGIDGPFVLYVGLLQPRKNLDRLAAAIARLPRHGLDHALVVAGPRAWLYGPMLEAIGRLGLGRRLHFTGYVPREDLPRLYAGAAAFAYVSRYEGFGIPVLEALACGAPTLASTDPALVEVAAGAALHVDPLDVDAIEAGLVRLIGDGALRNRLGEAGPRRAAHYTPAAMAAAAWAGYRTALGN